MKILYATDLDRTIIYSQRFLSEYKPDCEYSVAEKIGDEVISYISNNVKARLKKLNSMDNVEVIPVTSRSTEEFNRVDLGIETKYAIVANGGIILKDGEPIKEYENIILKDINMVDFMLASMDLSELKSVNNRESKFIDNRYIFNKTEDTDRYDKEVAHLIAMYPSLNFVRQRKKIYVIPKAFSKATAVRWLQTQVIKPDALVVSGDSELDIPMLALADYAVVPEHGDLVKCGYVTGGRIAKPGINSPMYAMDIIEHLLKNGKA